MILTARKRVGQTAVTCMMGGESPYPPDRGPPWREFQGNFILVFKR